LSHITDTLLFRPVLSFVPHLCINAVSGLFYRFYSRWRLWHWVMLQEL